MLNLILKDPVYAFLAAGIAVLFVWNVLLQIYLWRLKGKLKTFFAGKQASDLEGVLFEEIKRLKKLETDTKKLFQATDEINKMANQSIQKIGVVRFNPFKDTGGNQSFAIALLNSANNGLVISSLFSREGTRVYSKPILAGESKYPLSKEEMEALKKAETNK